MQLKSLLRLMSIYALLAFSVAVQAQEISMAKLIGYESDNDIPLKIINECTNLGSKLSTFTQSYAKKKGIQINLVDSVNTSSGKTLKVEISDAVSSGNAFIGHSKYVAIKGSLWENGKKVGSFRGRRSSGGGAFGGYKGSCSVLGRCVKTLGKDIAAWLADPVDGARIGE